MRTAASSSVRHAAAVGLVVTRKDGTKEGFLSIEWVPWWKIRRRLEARQQIRRGLASFPPEIVSVRIDRPDYSTGRIVKTSTGRRARWQSEP